VLIEREEQILRLRGAHTHNPAQGNVTLVSGAVGAGKTALLAEFADTVTAAGGRVLCGAGSVAERDAAFGVLGQLFQGAPLAAATAARVAELLADPAFAVTLPEPGAEPPAELRDTEPRRAAVVGELFGVLADLARRGRLLLVVDDLQHGDLPTLHFLLYLVRRLRYLPVDVVLAESAMLRPPHPLLRAELLSSPFFHRVTLPLLSAAGLAELAGDRDRAARCLELTGGSPLLANAVLTETGPEDGLEQAVLGCLYRHEPAVRRVAHALAVLDRPVPAEQLGRLLGTPVDVAAQALRSLRAAGLVEDDRLRHPRLVRAVLADLSEEDRRLLHGRAADVLHDCGAEPALVAGHLVAADRAGESWELPVLQEAAEQALAAGQPDVAGGYLRLIDRAEVPGAERATVTALQVESRWQVNPLAARTRLAELVDAGRTGGGDGTALTGVPYLLWQGRPDEAAAALGRAGDPVGSVDSTDPEKAARLAATKLLLALAHPDRAPAAAAPTPAGPPTSDPMLPALVLLSSALRPTAAGAGGLVPTAELLLHRHAQDDGVSGPLTAVLTALLLAGRPDRVVHWTGELLAGTPAPTWRAVLRALRAEASLRLGDLVEAESQARTALTELPPQAWGVALAVPLATLVNVSLDTGDLNAGERWLAQPVPAAAFSTPLGLLYLTARGRHHLAAGRLAQAAADLRLCGDLAREWGMDGSTLAPWRLELAAVHLVAGERGRARRLLKEQLAGADPRTRGRALRMLAASAPPDQRRALLAEAVDLLQGSGDRVELARALGDTSVVLRRIGYPARAQLLLQRARHLAQDCGAGPLARRLQGRQPVGTRRPRRTVPRELPEHGLSEAERRVAALAAQGRTNRQISGELYITVSTVEQHLTRVYRKLAVKRRSELPARMHMFAQLAPATARMEVS
jgi:DNA-binding CsgD family transcriptional regulator